MKTSESNRIAGISAIVLTLLGLLFFVVNYLLPNLFISLLISIPLFFLSIYFITNYLIDKFIEQKVKPIYKTIHSFKPNPVPP